MISKDTGELVYWQPAGFAPFDFKETNRTAA